MKASFLCLLALLLLAAQPSFADSSGKASQPIIGILTIPAVVEGDIYFAGWGNKFYAFDELKNEEHWNIQLDPPLDAVDVDNLPAPPPTSLGSCMLLHLGRRLWAVSKIDGRIVWHVDGLPRASWRAMRESANPSPGYVTIAAEASPSVITLEADNTEQWYARSHRLGDGGVEWEYKLPGNPSTWWADESELLIVCTRPDQEAISDGKHPGSISCLDPKTGLQTWITPEVEGADLKASIRSGGRIFLLEEIQPGQFQVRAFNDQTGELLRTITYQRGKWIWASESDGKLVFLHETEFPDKIDFSLYYTSLNPIRFQPMARARPDQPFFHPAVDGNLFMYGGSTYSLYDGSQVWSWKEDEQEPVVDWAGDADHLYLWEKTGSIVSIEKLTGKESWRTAFNNLPPDSMLGPNYGGAGMVLDGARLLIVTPGGELYRVNTSTGQPYPGVLRVATSVGNAKQGAAIQEKRPVGALVWIFWVFGILALIILAAIGVRLAFEQKKAPVKKRLK